MSPRRRIRPSTIATIIAVAAIVLGVVDSMQTRAHNRLSVKPYLVVDYSVSARPQQMEWSVSVSNEGVGPGIIRSMRIELPAGLGGGSHESWGPAVDALRARGAEVSTYWNFEGGEALGVQRSRQLMRLLVPDSARALIDELAGIDVVVRYESIYGEEFSASLR